MEDARLDLVVFGAFPPELAPLQVHLGEAMCGRLGRAFVTARIVGIGLPMAATSAAMHLGELNPRAALLVGTCGAYVGSDLSIGEVVVARRIRLVAPCSIDGRSQFPEPMALVTHTHAAMMQSIELATGARTADVATTLAITVDDATAARIARATGVHVEHLEAHAVATACAAREVPFGAMLGVANVVGARGREEWRRHHREAAMHATDAVLKWLRSEDLPVLISPR